MAIVISNFGVSTTTGWPVGFWWSELSHPYIFLTEKGYAVDVFSPGGGKCEADAMSDPRDPSGYSDSDIVTLGFLSSPKLAAVNEDTRKVSTIDVAAYDAIVVAGGQGPMFTFEKATDLHRKFVEFYEAGKVACALCHGAAVLRYARLSNGQYLVKGKAVTGFAGNRGFTCTAREDEASLYRALDQHHARAKQEFRTSGLSPGVWTSVWKPHHINALWVRCLTCEQPNDVTDRHRQCTNCGAELSPQPVYW